MKQPIHPSTDELTWQAFQYVAGEFSAIEAELFEERLATDQAAREAVAQAVELFHAVCAAEAAEPVITVAATQRFSWSRAFAIFAAGTAAAVALIAAAINTEQLSLVRSKGGQKFAAVTPALADVWSSVRSDFANEYAAPEEAASQPVSASLVLSEAEMAVAEEDLALSTEAPSWMTAAILGLSNASPEPLDSGKSAPQEN